ncbi:MAG: WYL domain-containing protein [Mucilaginibacter polytrichastri]|nr:WYL domain-containing protein [Mucilaginibacter polytrichastri]
MPTNLDALTRYHTIDQCLQNRGRTWTLEDLAQACFAHLDERAYRKNKGEISTRTIAGDIKVMRSNDLGYNAPIVCRNGYYTYADPGFSIRNATLSTKDLENIAFAMNIMRKYKGFRIFEQIENIFDRLETNIHIRTRDVLAGVVQFETLGDTEGFRWLRDILDAITQEKVISIRYKRFEDKSEKEHTLHPYLLKEFRNRWYVVGLYHGKNRITTFALDRIVELSDTDIAYDATRRIDPERYFKDTIGITYTAETPIRLQLAFTPHKAHYIRTQPLHASQKILADTDEGLLVELTVIHNYELENLILGMIDEVEIRSPDSFARKIAERIKNKRLV